jgi:hypothetical protein
MHFFLSALRDNQLQSAVTQMDGVQSVRMNQCL